MRREQIRLIGVCWLRRVLRVRRGLLVRRVPQGRKVSPDRPGRLVLRVRLEPLG